MKIVKREKFNRSEANNYTVIPDAILHARMKPLDKLVFFQVFKYQRDGKPCEASNRWMAVQFDMKPDTISKALRDLKRDNLVCVAVRTFTDKKIVHGITYIAHSRKHSITLTDYAWGLCAFASPATSKKHNDITPTDIYNWHKQGATDAMVEYAIGMTKHKSVGDPVSYANQIVANELSKQDVGDKQLEAVQKSNETSADKALGYLAEVFYNAVPDTTPDGWMEDSYLADMSDGLLTRIADEVRTDRHGEQQEIFDMVKQYGYDFGNAMIGE